MGGDCIGSDLTMLSTGIDFLKATIQVALGEEPDLVPVHPPQIAEIKFIMNEADLKAFEKIKNNQNIIRYFISEHQQGNVVDSSSRLGYYIRVCDL